MKQLLKNVFIALVLVFAMASCYDEYKVDYDYTSTYFSMQSPLRTVVDTEGEALTFEFGTMLSGRYENTANEVVEYEIAPSMLADTTVPFKLLPESYYELSNNSQITIESGSKLGVVTVTLNENFTNDDSSYIEYYALPLRIVSTTIDSILPDMDSTIIAVKCQNKYYGAYRVQGVDYKLDATNQPVDTTIYTNEDFHQNAYTVSGSLSKNIVTLPYMGKEVDGSNSMKVTLNNNAVVIESFNVEANVVINGSGSYDADSKKFYLDYTYDKAGELHQVYDTLTHFAVPMSLETWR